MDLSLIFHRAKPFLAVIFMQFGLAGMDILSKVALNQGMSNYVLVVYRHAAATIVTAPLALIFDKKTRPKMTPAIFFKVLLLGLLEMERVNITSRRSQAKIFGTMATVAGAMIMTLVTGPALKLFWTRGSTGSAAANVVDISLHEAILGSILITIGCFSWAAFVILQAITLKTYPAELSLTVWICLMGTLEGSALAFVMERGNSSVWAIKWDTRLLAAVYSGVFCSGLAYYIQGMVMKKRGPVFVTAFNPLCMVIVAVVSSIFLSEQMRLGRVLGAIVIVLGLYLVIWGKSKDYDSPPKVIDEKIASDVELGNTTKDGKENENTKEPQQNGA
ncbi:WAT1-related protein [Drosera capensis]